jgi:hypothetical protein
MRRRPYRLIPRADLALPSWGQGERARGKVQGLIAGVPKGVPERRWARVRGARAGRARAMELENHGKAGGTVGKGGDAVHDRVAAQVGDEIGAKSAGFGVRRGLSEPTNTPLARGVAGRVTRGIVIGVRRSGTLECAGSRIGNSFKRESSSASIEFEHLVEQSPW